MLEKSPAGKDPLRRGFLCNACKLIKNYCSMTINRISLFRNERFEFFIHLQLIWQFAVISWTLATGIFPYYYKYLPQLVYWWMGVAATLALITSVLLRDTIRLLILNWFGTPATNLTLFLFGGVTEPLNNTGQQKGEFFTNLIGPVIYFGIALFVHCVMIICQTQKLPLEIIGIIEFIRMINVALGVLNIFPLLVMDGGKIVLFFLSRFFVSYKRAIAFLAETNSVVSLLIMAAGVFVSIKGYFQGGLWWILFGMYLREGTLLFLRKHLIREILKSETAERVMRRDPVTVCSGLSIKDFVKNYLYNFHYKIFPVLSYDLKMQGVLLSRKVFDLPCQQWEKHTVNEIAISQLTELTVDMKENILSVLTHMQRTGQSRLVVIDEKKQPKGTIVLKDILKYLSEKMNL